MTQSILIGNPLQLTRKGILELHKLKNKETYCYILKEDLKFGREGSSLELIAAEEFVEYEPYEIGTHYTTTLFLLHFYMEPYSWKPTSFKNHVTTSISTMIKVEARESHETFEFMNYWKKPRWGNRSDRDLLKLYRINKEKCFLEGARKFVIPEGVKFDIRTDKQGREYIQEKARTWG